jgi:serine/threonine-protein kinase HipA
MTDPGEEVIPDPTRISRAIVYKGEQAAGELLRDRDDVVFRYFADYLDGPGRPVATTLPKSRQEYRTHGGSVPAFFAGLLPEGRRLQALTSSLKTSSDDEYSMLLAVGRDCVGDIRVLSEEEDARITAPVPSIEHPGDVSFGEILESSLALGHRSRDAAIPGVQDKLSDSMISLPVGTGVGGAILKLNPSGYPLLVENEAYVLDMARAAGLRVPTFALIRDRDGRPGLSVDRFDRRRTAPGDGVRRIAQEDAVQLAGRWPSAKYRMSTREVFAAVLAVATAKPVAAEDLLRQFAFSYVVANGDLHAKNVSVYFEPDGIWSVTPAYDLVCTLPYGDDRMALEFDGRDLNLTGAHFLAFGERHGLNARVVNRMLDEVTAGVEPLIESLGTIGFDERRTAAMARELTRRIQQLRKLS